MKDIDIQLFGDFVLHKQPTTFEDSVRVYQTLPTQLGKAPDYTNVVGQDSLNRFDNIFKKKKKQLFEKSRTIENMGEFLIDVDFRTELI